MGFCPWLAGSRSGTMRQRDKIEQRCLSNGDWVPEQDFATEKEASITYRSSGHVLIRATQTHTEMYFINKCEQFPRESCCKSVTNSSHITFTATLMTPFQLNYLKTDHVSKRIYILRKSELGNQNINFWYAGELAT